MKCGRNSLSESKSRVIDLSGPSTNTICENINPYRPMIEDTL